MAKSLLRVRVFGGTPPFSIQVQLYQGGEVVKGFGRGNGFEYLFDGLSGKYSLMVSGPNPLSPDKKTIIELSTDEITLSNISDPSPAVRVGKAYLVEFHFSTKRSA